MEITIRIGHQDDRKDRPQMGNRSRRQHVSLLCPMQKLKLMKKVRVSDPPTSVPGQQEQAG
jgi:hypothetical protein